MQLTDTSQQVYLAEKTAQVLSENEPTDGLDGVKYAISPSAKLAFNKSIQRGKRLLTRKK